MYGGWASNIAMIPLATGRGASCFLHALVVVSGRVSQAGRPQTGSCRCSRSLLSRAPRSFRGGRCADLFASRSQAGVASLPCESCYMRGRCPTPSGRAPSPSTCASASLASLAPGGDGFGAAVATCTARSALRHFLLRSALVVIDECAPRALCRRLCLASPTRMSSRMLLRYLAVCSLPS